MKTSDLRAGMTLVEILVAFVVFLMLLSALVAFAGGALETWTLGETRKDVYDRARVVLDALSEDLRNVYSENVTYDDGRKELQAPAFVSDPDAGGRPRLRFVRTGTRAGVRAPSGENPPRRRVPPMDYADLWEISYVMDPDPAKNVLWRGARVFDRSDRDTLLRPENYDEPTFARLFRPAETGVLHVGFEFWSQYSSRGPGPRSRPTDGPEMQWDSTRRRDKQFRLYRKAYDARNPDFVYPEIVKVTAVIETSDPERHGIKLSGPCGQGGSSISVTHTRGLPDGPALVKIEGEWVEYAALGFSDLQGAKRGRRGTRAQSHPDGAPVRFGETFTTEVRLAAYREAQEP